MLKLMLVVMIGGIMGIALDRISNMIEEKANK